MPQLTRLMYGPEERRHRLKTYGIFTRCGLRISDTNAKVTAKSRDVTCEKCRELGGDRWILPRVA